MPLKNLEITALILVGGEGTRLRPLTHSVCKPMLQFVNKPILVQQIDELYKAGVRRIVLATSIKHKIENELLKLMRHKDLVIIFSEENTVLGTAGAIKNAEKFITYPCFILNGDIICEYPFYDMMSYHIRNNKDATILSTNVKDPSRYGVLVTNEMNEIVEFVEKPKNRISTKINAGVYIINKNVVDLMPNVECSIEKEIFPILSKNNQLLSYDLTGYWMDIGQPKDFINGIQMFLDHNAMFNQDDNRTGDATYYKNKRTISAHDKKNKESINFYNLGEVNTFEVEKSFIDDTAVIGEGCVIGPNAVIGKNVKIGRFATIRDCTIFDNVTIGDASYICRSLIGWGCKIGKWVRIDEVTVLGKDVVVDDFLLVYNCFALPDSKIITNEIDYD